MNLLYISKYAIYPEHGSPTRQYFLSKNIAESGNHSMVINSKSSLGKIPSFKGLYKKDVEGNLQKITINGPEIESGFSFQRLKSWVIFEYNLFRFRNKIKEFKPDVIIVSSLSILTFLSGVFLKKWLKKPLVVEVRDIYPLTLMDVGGYKPSHPAIKVLSWVEKIGYKNADLILSPLPNAKEHIAGVINQPFKFKWLPMGVDLKYYTENNEQSDNSPFVRDDNKFYVCYAGNIGVGDSLEDIFEIAVDFKDKYPQIHFIFIGSGPKKAYFQEQYGKIPNITIMDPISKKALQPFLGKMDLLINTWMNKSIYKYGISPNKWMDYMYAGKPILVAYSGYRCIIDDAGCGTFVDAENKDAIKEGILLYYNKSKEERNEIGLRGRAYLLKHHDYKLLANELLESLTIMVK